MDVINGMMGSVGGLGGLGGVGSVGSVGRSPLLIKDRQLKAINTFYNKQRSC
ncbi:MAG: hypothetical protein F6K40_14150 [Okeania sp. SIO3I5]|uniref:hypothetical protein n=1 Tax=Okeania sp. SIO3I5 TaxID=2607805 RepID=UPI0013B8A9C6|nr:hypothetical protein [Okeania sp. SIO3I5]NEQ37345.1 hypothetical protein [Okeania sp. SIO3I5]